MLLHYIEVMSEYTICMSVIGVQIFRVTGHRLHLPPPLERLCCLQYLQLCMSVWIGMYLDCYTMHMCTNTNVKVHVHVHTVCVYI